MWSGEELSQGERSRSARVRGLLKREVLEVRKRGRLEDDIAEPGHAGDVERPKMRQARRVRAKTVRILRLPHADVLDVVVELVGLAPRERHQTLERGSPLPRLRTGAELVVPRR